MRYMPLPWAMTQTHEWGGNGELVISPEQKVKWTTTHRRIPGRSAGKVGPLPRLLVIVRGVLFLTNYDTDNARRARLASVVVVVEQSVSLTCSCEGDGSKSGLTGIRLGGKRWRDKERSQYTGSRERERIELAVGDRTDDLGKRLKSELVGFHPRSGFLCLLLVFFLVPRVLEFEGLEKMERGEVKRSDGTMEHWPLSALVYNANANRALRKVCEIGFEVGLSSYKGLWTAPLTAVWLNGVTEYQANEAFGDDKIGII
ncbi:hypothetical protein BJV77DRAFT_966934 [Russula vinacea]|nr:hypothetical protein BJV77DRAFT_966934 [Russula vinacea]